MHQLTPTPKLNPVQTTLAGDYRVEVSNDFGTIPSFTATLTTSCAPADFNCDGTVADDDAQVFLNCMTGPAVFVRPDNCSPQQFDLADADNDGDVDQVDYGIFQRCYNGPGKPPAPGCSV